MPIFSCILNYLNLVLLQKMVQYKDLRTCLNLFELDEALQNVSAISKFLFGTIAKYGAITKLLFTLFLAGLKI